jgi:molybdopterin molybdotransferase
MKEIIYEENKMETKLSHIRHDPEDHVHYHGVDRAEEHITVEEALRQFLDAIQPISRSERVSAVHSLGRILFEKLVAPRNVPELPRSTRDGYAVKASHLIGNKEYELVGEVKIGVPPGQGITIKSSNEAVRVATGSFLPSGADCVIMKEYVTQNGRKIIATRAATKWENVLRAGADIERGEVLLVRGTRIRPQHIALLSLLGIRNIRVFKKPVIAFLSTGNELIDSIGRGKRRNLRDLRGKIFDVTRPFIASMIAELGCLPLDLGIARDELKAIKSTILRGLDSADAVILSAGSSVGEKDYASSAVRSITGVRILVHGIAMRPASPTGLAVFGNKKPLILLPGFPTSAIVSFLVFAQPAIHRLSGNSFGVPWMIQAKLTEGQAIPVKGIKQFIRLRVERKGSEYVAKIVRPSEASYSNWLAKANAIGIVDEKKSERIKPEEKITAFPIADLN